MAGYYYFAMFNCVSVFFLQKTFVNPIHVIELLRSMRKRVLFLFAILSQLVLFAQQDQLTLEKIWSGEFRTEGLAALRSMNDGKHYTVQNFDASAGEFTVDKYDYETQAKVGTILSSNDIAINGFSSYTFSDDESKLLLATEEERVYRWSRLGIYYVYDIATKQLTKLFDQKIQEPALSPDGSKAGFVFENNLYVKDLTSGDVKQITTDGVKNKIINGITDWVYEEEFGFVRAYDWSTDSQKIAFLRFDEAAVPEFSMDVYGKALYPSQQVFKYPKAGETNATVSLHLHDLTSDNTVKADVGEAYYIPRIHWTKDANVLSVQTLNRHQNDLKLYVVNTADNTSEVVLNETSDTYVDITDDLTFLNDNSFIWTSERDGFNHIYHYDRTGKLIKQITQGDWEVTAYYGFDPKRGVIYYQSTEDGSINRAIYSIGKNGKGKRQLTQDRGTNSASFSNDFTYFINVYSSAARPPVFTLHKARNGDEIMEIKNNDAVAMKAADHRLSEKEFFTIKISSGEELNAWMIKPPNFDARQQYPLLMFQYSGPGSQQVANRWNRSNDYWHQLLAQQGYVVACVDGRGTGYKGADFKKMTYKELGKYEVEDQIEAAKILGASDYIDASRIGIWGWSYGGFMSSNCLLKGNDVFKMAIAVAPVTSWRFYDTIYTERYMQTPQENASGYDDNSPINHVDKLKGKYLLVHGSGDDNVHVQNTMRMIEALVQANKEFEWAVYPDRNHGIYGGNTRLHLYTKMTNFIKENL